MTKVRQPDRHGLYYIVDTRNLVGNCVLFWGPNRSGYVCDLAQAGKYSEEEAKGQQQSRPTDVAVPCDVVERMAVSYVRGDTEQFKTTLLEAGFDPSSRARSRR